MTNLVVGTDRDKKFPVGLTPEERSTHMHVMGSTGSGKSRFLISLIKQDIRNGQGLCLIDPHGELYHHLEEWLSNRSILAKRRTIRLLDFSDPEYAVGFNPLAISSKETIASTVEAVTKGITIVYGGDDPNATPLIKSSMDSVCHALIDNDLTLIESEFLMNYEQKDIRYRLTDNLQNPQQRRIWQSLNARRPIEFNHLIESTERRLRDFLNADVMRRIFGQRENTIDFGKAMDDGDIILINCSLEGGIIPPGAQRLAGMLVINNLVARAFERKSKPAPKPFHLYIDEAPRFLTHDIADILVGTRKYGLHVTLAHQNLSQLRAAGDQIYSGVMGEARTKVVFGGLSMEDAKVMAEETLYGEVSPYMINEAMNKPTVVGYERIKLKNKSFSEGTGTNETSTETQSNSVSTTNSHSRSIGTSEGYSAGTSVTQSNSESQGSSSSHASGSNTGRSLGTSASNTIGDSTSNMNSQSDNTSSSDGQSQLMSTNTGLPIGPNITQSGSDTQGSGYGSASGSSSNTARGSSASETNTESTSSNISRANSNSRSTGISIGTTTGTSFTHSSSESQGSAYSQGSSSSTGKSTGTSESSSWSEGYSESLEPILEWLPTQLVSTDDQYMELAKFIKDQPQRYGILRTPTGKVYRIKSLDIPDEYVSKTQMAKLKKIVRDKTPFVQTRDRAEQEILSRQAKLLRPVEDRNLDDTDFLE